MSPTPDPAGPTRRAVLGGLGTVTGAVLGGGLTAVLAACSRSGRPPKLTGAARDAEIQRLRTAIRAVPHVVRENLEYFDNVTNGQSFAGDVTTDTVDQAQLDAVLAEIVKILWSTTAFYPGAVSTTVVGSDGTTLADYRTLGAADSRSILSDELEKRFGPSGFLSQKV